MLAELIDCTTQNYRLYSPDSVQWDYINNVLRKYNFGDSFIKWYNLLYPNSSSCVINNGNISEFLVQVEHVGRMTCLVHIYLFLQLNLWQWLYKKNEKIIGTPINNRIIEIGQYTFLLLENLAQSLRSSLNLLHNLFMDVQA